VGHIDGLDALGASRFSTPVGNPNLGTLISNDNSVQKGIQRRILAGSRT